MRSRHFATGYGLSGLQFCRTIFSKIGLRRLKVISLHKLLLQLELSLRCDNRTAVCRVDKTFRLMGELEEPLVFFYLVVVNRVYFCKSSNVCVFIEISFHLGQLPQFNFLFITPFLSFSTGNTVLDFLIAFHLQVISNLFSYIDKSQCVSNCVLFDKTI